MLDLIPCIHNVSSVQRLVDAAKLAYSMGFATFVATSVHGAAAVNGVPEVSRLAFKLSRNFVILSDLKDLKELFSGASLLLVHHEADRELEDALAEAAKVSGKVLVAVSGQDAGFTPTELSHGIPVKLPGVNKRLGPLPELTLALYIGKQRAIVC